MSWTSHLNFGMLKMGAGFERELKYFMIFLKMFMSYPWGLSIRNQASGGE